MRWLTSMDVELTVLRALLAQSPERSRWVLRGWALVSELLLGAGSTREDSGPVWDRLLVAAVSKMAELPPEQQKQAVRGCTAGEGCAGRFAPD